MLRMYYSFVFLLSLHAALRYKLTFFLFSRRSKLRTPHAALLMPSSTRNYTNESTKTSEEAKNAPKEQQVAQTTPQTKGDVAVQEQGRGGDRSIGFVDPFDNFAPTEVIIPFYVSFSSICIH
jgi:hypothetical protein